MSRTCRSSIVFGDDYGDNETTFHCQLPEGHEGNHQEEGRQYDRVYLVTWKRRPARRRASQDKGATESAGERARPERQRAEWASQKARVTA